MACSKLFRIRVPVRGVIVADTLNENATLNPGMKTGIKVAMPLFSDRPMVARKPVAEKQFSCEVGNPRCCEMLSTESDAGKRVGSLSSKLPPIPRPSRSCGRRANGPRPQPQKYFKLAHPDPRCRMGPAALRSGTERAPAPAVTHLFGMHPQLRAREF